MGTYLTRGNPGLAGSGGQGPWLRVGAVSGSFCLHSHPHPPALGFAWQLGRAWAWACVGSSPAQDSPLILLPAGTLARLKIKEMEGGLVWFPAQGLLDGPGHWPCLLERSKVLLKIGSGPWAR